MALLLGMNNFMAATRPSALVPVGASHSACQAGDLPALRLSPNQDFIAELRKKGAEIIFLNEVTVGDYSSSQIRQELEAGTDPQVLVERGWILLKPSGCGFLTTKASSRFGANWTPPPPIRRSRAAHLPQGESLEARVGQQLLAQS